MIEKEEGLKRTKSLQEFFKLILRVVNVIIVIVTIIAYCGKNQDPSKFNVLYFLSLILPALFFINIFSIILKMILRRKISFFLLVQFIVIIVLGKDLIGINLKKEEQDNGLKIISYNVRGFNFFTKNINSIYSIKNEIDKLNPDFICMQEYLYFTDTAKINFYNLIRDEYPYYFISKTKSYNAYNGLAIFSKYEIINEDELYYKDKPFAQFLDIVVNNDTLGLINTHLHSTYFNQISQNYINSDLLFNSNSKKIIETSFGELIENVKVRTSQIENIKNKIQKKKDSYILCGDFNESNFTYNYTLLKGDLCDSFQESGFGYSSTYKGLMNIFCTDYILYTNKIESVQYNSPNLNFSDHNPVIMSFIIK